MLAIIFFYPLCMCPRNLFKHIMSIDGKQAYRELSPLNAAKSWAPGTEWVVGREAGGGKAGFPRTGASLHLRPRVSPPN